jgi:orotidine-5'-phosphate decarboxylase
MTQSPLAAPIAVALDAPDLATATRWAGQTAPYVSVMKIGLQTFLRDGHDGVRAISAASGRPIFLDLKLHDIPTTVAGAATSIADLAPAYVTVHAAGGTAMVAAAVERLPGTVVTGVTVLTSLDAAGLAAIGMRGTPGDAVRRLAALAVSAGAKALVCSPQEVAMVRAEVGPDITLITPGVRPAGADAEDQARVATPEQALADGADLLVVGRPITGADDPGAAARHLAGLVAAAVPTR